MPSIEASATASQTPVGRTWPLASVLVVDDEPGMVHFIGKTLESVVGSVMSAGSAEQAQTLVDLHRFDLIILDISLPGRSGLDWLQALRGQGIGCEVVLITAFADLESAITALRAGASDFILKPFRIPQVLNSVRQCLERAQYYGVAQADFFLRAGDGSFALNYAKSCLGIWFSMLLVTAMGVMFSTFLAGPVALLATLSMVMIGQFRQFIAQLFESQVTGDATIVPGGGPIESLYRIVTQMSITVPLDPTPAVQAMKTVDTILLAPMRLAAGLFPSLSSLGTSNFVADGFDIPFDLLAANAVETLGYVLAFLVAGSFCLRAREVAS